MRTLFDGDVHVSYRQVYVNSVVEFPEQTMPDAFAGQVNGLCGAAVPGFLFMTTDLHTGHVGFIVERHDDPPPVDDGWEEIVEVSFTPMSREVNLIEWGGGVFYPLYLEPVDLRVRYCARGMDAGADADTRLDGPQHDRYLLQFWPQATSADRVLKQTSRQAASWHDFARSLPPPPSAEEIAERERQAERERVEAERAWNVFLLWGSDPPSERVQQAGGNVIGLVRLDRALAEALAAAGPEVQRAVARWAARCAYDIAGLSSLDWIAPALDALDRGDSLPPPFDDETRVWQRLFSDTRVPQTMVTSTDGGPRNVSQQAFAAPALFGAAEPEPLRAAIDALFAAAGAFGDEYPRLFDEVRQAFSLPAR